jgi:uncharacterized repeat protein (TIGR03803 family)
MSTTRPFGILVIAAAFYLCASASQIAAQTKVSTEPGATFTTLQSFNGKDGRMSNAGMVQATNGNLYGTTYFGGAKNSGEVFEIATGGTLTTLHSFCSKGGCTDGEYTYATPVQGTDGNFYGTTYSGGANGNGTVFEITTNGTFTPIYNVCSESGCPDGNYLYAGLIQATDGNLYGIMDEDGANGGGTIFRITTTGTLTILYSLCSQSGCADGQYPAGELFQDTNGSLYGTTADGGANDDGTIFSLSIGLSPFVEAQPASGIVGATVRILGTDLTGATSVTFNGTTATFTVVSISEITTTIPKSATSGEVQVMTPSGLFLSNVPFQVLPQRSGAVRCPTVCHAGHNQQFLSSRE